MQPYNPDQDYVIVDSNGVVVHDPEKDTQDDTSAPPEVIIAPNSSQARKLRKQYVTVKSPVAPFCGHRLDLSHKPRHANCKYCWWAFFTSHPEVVQQLHEMEDEGAGVLIEQLQGHKFAQRWHAYAQAIKTLSIPQAVEDAHDN